LCRRKSAAGEEVLWSESESAFIGGDPPASTGEDTDVKTKLTLCNCIILFALAATALLLAGGCGGGPKEDPAKFVGTWAVQYPEDFKPPYPETMVLRGDGSAARAGGYEPHAKKYTWLLYRGKLVLAPREGTRKATFDFRFNGPDELILIPEGEDLEVTFRRAEEE